MTVVIRKPYDERYRVCVDCSEGGLTHQSFKKECDINTIMRKFEKDQMLEHVSRLEGSYGDFGDGTDFHESLNIVRRAEEMFMTLPAAMRAEFSNDPSEFLTFTATATEEQLRERGLAVPAASAEADQVPAADRAAEPPVDRSEIDP